MPSPAVTLALAASDRIVFVSVPASGSPQASGTLAGPSTGLQQITGVAVAHDGRIVVSELGPCCSLSPRVEIFAKGSTGDAAPSAQIAGPHTGLAWPAGVAVGAKGTIYVANYQGGSITEYPAGATGDVAPTRTITGLKTQLWHPSALTVDDAGDVYVVDDGTQSLEEFAPGTNGNIKPKARLWGRQTRLSMPEALALGYHGELYVADREGSEIAVYRLGKSENLPPVRVIGGPGSALNGVEGLAVAPDGTLYAAENAGMPPALDVFPPGASGTAAPAARLPMRASLTELAGVAISG